jgi:branched-chain amino acid transport system permease protein
MSRARVWTALFMAALVVLPFLIQGRLSLSIFVFIGLYSLIVLGLTLLAGHAGQVSLGQAAFYGLGAYISSITTLRGLDPWIALPLSVGGSALVAFLIGAPIFVLRGHYLVLGTLGFNIVVDVFIRNLQHLTGGPTGLTGIPPLQIGEAVIAGDRAYYYLTWGFLLAGYWLCRNLIHSRIGRTLVAIRSSEVAAASLGINPAYYKGRMLALSAGLAGLAGALYVHYLSFVSPSPFAFTFSIDLLVMSVLGGIYHLPGAVLGTGILTALREVLRTVMPRLLGTGASAEYEIIVFGLLLAVVVILSPRGVWPGVAALLRIEDRDDPAKSPVTPREILSAGGATSDPQHGTAAQNIVLEVNQLQKRFGGLLAVHNLSFSVRAGEVYAIIGPNGAGKTTAFNLISGVLRPTRGVVRFRGAAVTHLAPYRIAALGVGRTFQTPKVFGDLTVLENVMVGLPRPRAGAEFFWAMLGLGRREDVRIQSEAAGYLQLVGILDRANERAATLPFGALRLLEIARALAGGPRLLLLDEPASGLTSAERAALVRLIRRVCEAGVTVMLVEHDVALVMGVADRVLVLNYGERVAEGVPAEVRADPRVIAAYLGEATVEEAS